MDILHVLIDELKENGIRRVLYCNLKKYNYQYKYDTDVGVIETQRGSKSYDMLLDILHEYASPKVVKDIDGNVIQTGRNTLYVPAIVSRTVFQVLVGNIKIQT